jgi:transposase
MKESKMKVFYLPAYSPELAPVELFFGRVKTSFKDTEKEDDQLKFERRD